jgi:hypothetical protein
LISASTRSGPRFEFSTDSFSRTIPVRFSAVRNHEIPAAEPVFSPEERAAIAALTAADIAVIDRAILANASSQWLKVVCVVVKTVDALKTQYPGLPYLFGTRRLRHLAEQGRLESHGNLDRVRFSVVRLPQRSPARESEGSPRRSSRWPQME